MAYRHLLPLGASLAGSDSGHFSVWAPYAQTIDLHLLAPDRIVPMQQIERSYYTCSVSGIEAGRRYRYRIDGAKERPDPASRHQPDGPHGPSAIVAPNFDWQDHGWQGPTLQNTVFYELHVGTFSLAGTLDGIIPYLPYLRDLGITTLQLMPVAQFPGSRNWGYDCVQLYAVQNTYGGPTGLKRLVNACHQAGLSVFLDLVYNHLGPEGNYLWDYGPYFTDRYRGGWGDSLNFDGPHSDEVRRFFIENALYWLKDFHIDGFRLDATHAYFDFSAFPFIEELTQAIHDWADRHNRRIYVIAENDRSDRHLILSRVQGGRGLDGQWLDDLHHVLHTTLTGENKGYYADYQDFALLPKVLAEGFTYTGQFSPARQRRHGTPSRDIPTDRFVVCTQNHDQVGNRMLGERLSQLTTFDGLKLAAGFALCSPYVPLLFMGEEYGETAPFLYFTSHTDESLIEAVRQGRAEEFADFEWQSTPPDPQAQTTFERCKLTLDAHHEGWHAILYRLYKRLLQMRRDLPALTAPHRNGTNIYADRAAQIVDLERHLYPHGVRVLFNFDLDQTQRIRLPDRNGAAWRKILDSSAAEWRPDAVSIATAPEELPAPQIALPPQSFAVYECNQLGLH